jgi:cytochrome c-type biogenesis protein CcmH
MMRALVRAVLLAVALLSTGAAHAVQPDEMLKDPALEARARTLSRELRCMVCQNQSIDDSEAPLARDLRLLVRERLKAGDSDSQVLNFLVARYGEFVLLKPRFEWHTALLWLTPGGVLLIGACALWLGVRKRRRGDPAGFGQPELTAAEKDRIAELTKTAAS